MRTRFLALGMMAVLLAPPAFAQENRSRDNEYDRSSQGQSTNRSYRPQDYRDDNRSSTRSTRDQDSRQSSQYSDRSDSSSNRSDQSHANLDASDVRQFLDKHDGDNDGYLTRNELPSHMRTGFSRIDRNDDGYLSQNELRGHAVRMARAQSPVQVTYIWVMDANQGAADLNDLQDAYDVLTMIDRNRDGQITRTELRERQSAIASQWASECFDCHDANEDNQIARSEVEGTQLADRFERLDANSDNRLSRSELRQGAINGSSSARTASGSTSRNSEDDDRR